MKSYILLYHSLNHTSILGIFFKKEKAIEEARKVINNTECSINSGVSFENTVYKLQNCIIVEHESK